MSYANDNRTIRWEVIPQNTPKVVRNCPKCGNGAKYINTRRFRVNANKRNLDVWLIYQCEACKSTWNMTIYERTSPGKLQPKEYEAFLANDIDLAESYGFDPMIQQRLKCVMDYSEVTYEILKYEGPDGQLGRKIESDVLIEIHPSLPLPLALDAVLAEGLRESKSKIRRYEKEGAVLLLSDTSVTKKKTLRKTVLASTVTIELKKDMIKQLTEEAVSDILIV